MQRSITTSLLRLSKTSFAQNSKRALSTSARATRAQDTKAAKETTKPTTATESVKPAKTETSEEKAPSATDSAEEQQPTPEGEEQPQQSAYDPETGEINWDCPCLGGMAHGPCGEEFKEAFSCFVYSEAEPKGYDCIEKFKNMQNCFRKYPEVYSEEIRDDEGPLDTLEPEQPATAVEGESPVAIAAAVAEETPVILSATPVVDVVEIIETPQQVEIVEEVFTVPATEQTKSE